MVTMLEVINRIPAVCTDILNHREETFAALTQAVKAHPEINQILLIGSGTSNTSAVTARRFIEKTSGLQTICVLPNELLYNCFAYNPNAFYVFTSHSGTSTLTCMAAEKITKLGYLTAAVTDGEDSPIAKMVDVFINQRNGVEEYLMRTIGYCSSVLTQMLMGMAIGKARGVLTDDQAAVYLDQAQAGIGHHPAIVKEAMAWFDRNQEKLMAAETFTLYGMDSLWGVALEGALKILEISKRRIGVGYEFDDGMHGPTMGYTPSNCVIVLHDGGREDVRAHQLTTFAKNELGYGYLIGENPIDASDLPISLTGGEFIFLELSPVVQVLAYRLAVDYGIDLADMSYHSETKYFNTHNEA